jgi:twitching motility protein PilI
VLLVAERHGFNAALLVDRVLGLRDARKWQKIEVDGQAEYHDEQSTRWHKLDIPGLLEQAEFLQIGI